MSYHILHFTESKRELSNHHMAVLGWAGDEEEMEEFTISPYFSEFNHLEQFPEANHLLTQ